MSSTALAPVKQAAAVVQTAVSKATSAPAPVPPTTVTPAKRASWYLTPQKSAPSTPQPDQNTPQPLGEPGRWLHPRMDEVIRRRNATNFDRDNVKTISLNVVAIAVSVSVQGLLKRFLPGLTSALQPLPDYAVAIICLIFATNIGFATLPLFRQPDACEDVPLTPSQRKLLGLPPMSRSATPREEQQYVTPPRFARSGAGTPRSTSSSIRAEAGDSPLSGRGGGGSGALDSSLRKSFSGSPFGSPTGSERRRLSYTSGRSSPLSISEFDAAGNISTPTKGSKASVGLNNKWLYEKGRPGPWGSPSGAGRNGLFS